MTSRRSGKHKLLTGTSRDEEVRRGNRPGAPQPGALYAHLVDCFPGHCILVLEPDGRVGSIHGASQSLIGDWGEDLLGQRLNASSPSRAMLRLSNQQLSELLGRVKTEGLVEIESELNSDGENLIVRVQLVRVGESGHIACLLTDLTEVKAMERALVRRNKDLSNAAERLKEVDMMKNEFLSNVSHELRTPLTAIIAYSEALTISTPTLETVQDFTKVIVEQGHKLQELISGLLDISKMNTLATELKLQKLNLKEIVESAVVTVRPGAEDKDILLSLELMNDMPLVYLDELRSQQIVWNLLNNAIKFSPVGGRIVVRSWVEAGVVYISVADNGPGIAPEHQALIFKKFVQVDGSSTRRHGGVGLGLDLVRHLVELHGGTISLESERGEGAKFTVGIPVEKRRSPRPDKKIARRG